MSGMKDTYIFLFLNYFFSQDEYFSSEIKILSRSVSSTFSLTTYFRYLNSLNVIKTSLRELNQEQEILPLAN